MPRTVISRRIRRPRGAGEAPRGDDDDGNRRELNLMMICCEENEPYGPAVVTATMFLELLVASYERYLDGVSEAEGDENDVGFDRDRPRMIRIAIYHAQRMDYPDNAGEWDEYDGVIIPGSLSAAYDTHVEWIRRLLDVIRTEIREKRRKTMAVCFGHQAFAHSFRSSAVVEANSDRMARAGDGIDDGGGYATARVDDDDGYGLATVCSVGPMAGRRAFRLTDEGRFLFGIGQGGDHRISTDGNEISGARCLEMLYTRGDMVRSIPSMGISLCGDGMLPNEACAYFASMEDASRFRDRVAAQDGSAGMDYGMDDGIASSACGVTSVSSCPMPYAITYQAHPEYMSATGFRVNYVNTIGAMEKRGAISRDICHHAREDAELNYDVLMEHCLRATISTGVILGWFR